MHDNWQGSAEGRASRWIRDRDRFVDGLRPLAPSGDVLGLAAHVQRHRGAKAPVSTRETSIAEKLWLTQTLHQDPYCENFCIGDEEQRYTSLRMPPREGKSLMALERISTGRRSLKSSEAY